MTQPTKTLKYLFLLSCINTLISIAGFSQALYPVLLDEKIANASLIVEGKVIAQQSFWNERHTMIYTSNIVDVYKIFKGASVKDKTIEVLTQGGSVGNMVIEASDLLTLEKNSIGMFFCFPNKINLKSPLTGELLFDVYSSAQGALTYDLGAKTASAPLARYADIQLDLYKAVSTKTGQTYKNIQPAFSVADISQGNTANRVEAVTVTSFSPASVNAGALLDPANNILSINGTGFGATPSGSCAVLFDDSNNGAGGTAYSVAYNDSLIISWSDTQIKVRTPARAGTGNIQVSDAAGNLGTAPAPLQVIYSVQTATFSISSVTYTKESNLMNIDGLGGYTILYSNNTANSGTDINGDPAKATFQRALTTWKEKTGFNVTEGGATTNQSVTADTINVITYDNTATGNAPLAAGVLATCYSYYTICTADPVNYQAQKAGFDIVIRKTGVSTGTTAFTFGPCPPNSSDYMQIDLETVILHELGHAVNLNHVNDALQGAFVGQLNPAKLMNYAVTNSVKRVSPDYSAYAGALYSITPQGNAYGTCINVGEMIPLATINESKDECPLSFPTSPLTPGTSVAFDLVHTTSNRFTDPAYTQVRCDAVGTPITNNAYYAFKTNNSGGILSLNITGYATTPAALVSCPQIYGGILVTGIRMALYQVASCPAAGAFPAPFACQTFTANGLLPDITGLAANTTYLLYLDGIENTKANFSVTFTGSALPLKLSGFNGKQYDHYNELYWTSEQVTGVKDVIVQRSADGTSFDAIGDIKADAVALNNIFRDINPLAKENYYRLAIVNNDGTKDYSGTVLLKRNDKFSITTYPVPAGNIINMDVTGVKIGTYMLTLTNTAGQKVKEVSSYLTSAGKRLTINTTQLAGGLYYLHLADEKGITIYNAPVVISH